MEVKRSYIETFYYAGKKKEDTVYQPIAVSQCVYVCVCVTTNIVLEKATVQGCLPFTSVLNLYTISAAMAVYPERVKDSEFLNFAGHMFLKVESNVRFMMVDLRHIK